MGGDLSSAPIHSSALLRLEAHKRYAFQQGASSSAEQLGVMAAYSQPIGVNKGDIALMRARQALQVDSKTGKSHGRISHAHQLVVARVFVPTTTVPNTPMPLCPDFQPSHRSLPSCRVEQSRARVTDFSSPLPPSQRDALNAVRLE